MDVLVGAEQTERHNHPDPGAASSWTGSRRALRPAPDADGDGPGDAEPYRLVIVDCPPSLGQLTRSALAAAHRAVLVTDPTMFAVSGVQRAFDAVQTERERGNPDLQPLGRADQPRAAAQQRARVPDRRAARAVRAAGAQRRAARPLGHPAGPGRVPADPAVGHPGRPGGLGGVHHPARPGAADLPPAPRAEQHDGLHHDADDAPDHDLRDVTDPSDAGGLRSAAR